MRGFLAVASFACLLAACATRTAAVDQRLILPEGSARYELADHQAFVFPVPAGNAAPGFPGAFEPRELPPTTLCASFVVDVTGVVRHVRLLRDPGCADPGVQPQLGATVVAAVSEWHYQPAMFCTYPDADTRNRDWNGNGCAGAVEEAMPVAVTLAYAFTFEVRNGRQRVGAARRAD
ncbi:energy transducer TonB [Pseudoxanthomonas sp. 10H]|uniref:energy transducer TonB n=1 Tax=Pseudoxanthomonas sp. 10H TaxID=3242729 RepID=UPI0035574210